MASKASSSSCSNKSFFTGEAFSKEKVGVEWLLLIGKLLLEECLILGGKSDADDKDGIAGDDEVDRKEEREVRRRRMLLFCRGGVSITDSLGKLDISGTMGFRFGGEASAFDLLSKSGEEVDRTGLMRCGGRSNTGKGAFQKFQSLKV